MARGKSNKLAPFQKLLTIMVSGKPVTITEIDATLGKEIYVYRLSTYIWHIKTNANGVIKTIKDGRKVTAYQLMNVDEIKKYLTRLGIKFASSTSVKTLDEIKTKEVKAPVTKAPVAEELEVIEVEVQDPV